MKPDIYAYGMTCLSTIHVLDGDYPPPDTYREIQRTYVLPSGEAGNAALLLAGFGLTVKLDGPVLGVRTRDAVLAFYTGHGIDCGGMAYDPEFAGVEDLVLVDGSTRTIFGRFAHYHGSGENRWSAPDRKAIAAAHAVSLDHGFGAASMETAALCSASGTPYVTIDLPPDHEIHRRAAVSILSPEYLNREFPGADHRALFDRYVANTDGLVIFTRGGENIRFARRNGEAGNFKPFRVEVKGSLAAGDFFRGGAVYAVSRRWPDKEIVAFSTAVGALACARFPAALDPPRLDEALALAKLC